MCRSFGITHLLHLFTPVCSRHRPSEYEDVEVAYQQSGCQQLTAVPIITDSHHVLGVLLLGMPTACTLPEQCVHSFACEQYIPSHRASHGGLGQQGVPC
jgi:hypothetical protein